MVFSSVPLYLDPPNWQQQQQLQANGSARNEINNINNHHHLIPPPPPLPQPPPPHHHQLGLSGTGSGSPPVGRPTSMAERARLEKIPPPDAPLKCPRCDSTNTKFCYFNNYSLTQPRHFCKTCRRYWTRGGALRNVPVGGGFRKNKRSSGKSSSSSSTSTTSATATAKSSSSSLSSAGPTGGSFMASLQSMAQLGGMGSLAGLSFGGSLLHNNVNPLDQLDNYGISSTNNNINTLLSQHHQMAGGFPNFLGGYGGGGSSSSNFQNVVVGCDEVGKVVKMEDGLNIEKGILTTEMNATSSTTGGNNNININNINNNDNQFWGNTNTNNMWSLSGLNSTSTSHLL